LLTAMENEFDPSRLPITNLKPLTSLS